MIAKAKTPPAKSRRLPDKKLVVYTSGGIDPAIAYPLHEFLEIANIRRSRLRKLIEAASAVGITLVRDTGTPTVVGKDYLDYCEKCTGIELKPRGKNGGRPKGQSQPAK